MRIKKYILLSFTFLFCVGAPLVAESPGEPPKEMATPDPLSLKSQWWEFFDVRGEAYTQQAEKFKTHLYDLLSKLEGDQKDTASSLIQRLASHVDELPTFREQNPDIPAVKPFFDSYTLNQQIDLAKQISNLRSTLSNEKKEEKFLSNRNGKVAKHLDKLIIAYRDQTEETFQKFMTGLEILNTRFTLAINDQKLRYVKENRAILEKAMKRAEEELKYARSHSDFSQIDINEIAADLSDMKGKLEQARSGSLISELRASPNYDNSYQGKLKASLEQLEEYQLSIRELSAELSVLFQEVKLLISKLNLDEYEGSLDDLKNRFVQLSSQLDAIKAQANQWDQRNDEEFSRFDKFVDGEEESSRDAEKLGQKRAKKIQENRVLLNQIDEKIFTTNYMIEQLDQTILARQPAPFRVWTQSVDTVFNCCEQVLGWYDQPLFRVGDQPITARDVVNGLIVLVVAFFLSVFVRRLIAKGFEKRRLSHGFIYSINRLVHYSIMLVGVVFALSSVGLDFDRIYLVIGALGVGIGFGLQGIVNNFVSGLIILFTRNFKVGDLINLENGDLGSVTAINVQNTIIRTFDGVDVVVPNSNLVTTKFVNWTRKDPYKRFKVRFITPFGVDKEKLRAAIQEAAEKVPSTAGQANGLPDPDLWLVEFGEYGLIFELVVWANMFKSGNHGAIGTSYVWEVDDALRRHGFKLAYPVWQTIEDVP